MLLVLMFHKISEPLADTAKFEEFLIYLKKHYSIVVPGDKFTLFKTSVCLTFDDAYADFYLKVYPLLKKYNIPAVVAVPTSFILETTKMLEHERLGIKQVEAMRGDNYLRAPFCTWDELREMSESGLVTIAAHHHKHISVNNEHFSFEQESIQSKHILEQNIGTSIETLIYPYGHYNKNIHNLAKTYYKYIMRIGFALNFSWGSVRQLTYRVNADHFWKVSRRIKGKDKVRWLLKCLTNNIRGK